jgi:hypothetical protein
MKDEVGEKCRVQLESRKYVQNFKEIGCIDLYWIELV